MDSSNMGFDDDISLTDYIKENIKRPFFFHQHHFYTNFTKWVKKDRIKRDVELHLIDFWESLALTWL